VFKGLMEFINGNLYIPSKTTIYRIRQCYMCRSTWQCSGIKVHDVNTSEMHYNMLEFARFRRFCCCRNFGLLRRYFVIFLLL